jgi:DNA polymerase-3 subunit epsilon
MSALRDLSLLALDCQASGASPAHGDLLELGWALCGGAGLLGPVHSRFIVPRTERRVPRAIRELTGWSEARVAEAVPEREAWAALRADASSIARAGEPRAPCVIHYARFELCFLRDLHARSEPGEFPLDVVCAHAIAARLLPDLPRRNIRALAGYLGHSPELLRRSAGHVEATAFIWSALLPLLEDVGVRSWSELTAWLAQPAPAARRGRRVYPLAAERRRALPDRPGVYRFLRRNGDVLYVGKAVSVRKRVASHFSSGGRVTERGLELLTQVHEVACSETASLLEAALLEADEIKRLDPPYNVQLRSEGRSAWFASRDLREAVPAPDDLHRAGPLPSRRALAPFAALIALVEGTDEPVLCAAALAVPGAFLPEPALFEEGFRIFLAEHLPRVGPSARRSVACAARALWLARGRTELESVSEQADASEWDLARVRRRLERTLVQSGLLLRRARWLCLLADANVAFRERDAHAARALTIAGAQIVERCELVDVASVASLPRRRPRALRERQRLFDAASYDRLRVLVTELRRVHDEGGEVAIALGAHLLRAEPLAGLLRAV